MKLLVAFMLFTSFCFGQKVDISIKLVDLIIHNAKIISGPYTPEYSAMVVNKLGKAISRNAQFKGAL